jgi:hypothetical protein
MGIVTIPEGAVWPEGTFVCFMCHRQTTWADGTVGSNDAFNGQRFGCAMHLDDPRDLVRGMADYLLSIYDAQVKEEFNSEYGEGSYEQGLS